ncbi:MAG: pyridoxamine 5'-phosphate oxidase family protein [Acidobacteria bacterium]|jgi:PPOX class probable FMN-dependent enzyme|nr:pyridoxamine 5'-phosphate oxidase family protein [Acidobacteriota bacterium]
MELREVYAPAIERARKKTLRELDAHCRRFIALSPFVCLGTVGSGGADVTPRGDGPGFVHVLDATTLAMPDWPGNNRLDSLENLLEDPRVGLLFLIPGFAETLRVNGRGEISVDEALLGRWEKRPRSALVIRVEEAFLHCGKAMIRSRLWDPAARVERCALPSYGQMLKDQIEIADTAAEIEASVAEGYRNRLY